MREAGLCRKQRYSNENGKLVEFWNNVARVALLIDYIYALSVFYVILAYYYAL